MNEMTLKEFIDEYSHGTYDFDRAGTTTCKGCVSTLSRADWISGRRFYESKFFKFAIHAMQKLSLEAFLQDATIEQDDCMVNLEDVLSKDAELWSEASPDQLFNEFFEQIRHEVWKYEEQLKANPKKFVKLFRLVLGRELLARQLAKATASGNTAEAETLRGGVENRDKFIVLLFA